MAEPLSGEGCSGGVSSLKSPADQGYPANERPAVSFEAFIPSPLPVAVLSVPPVPVDVGTHRREGGTRLTIAFGNPAPKKSTLVKLSLKPRFIERRSRI